ncbi:response regulator [Desertivirga brevis]|uniref:response regulator n=1 Tax=Desertivirga brevis TaxID=2810310 RepID=UPI001A963ECA|nr:response regulator [Pedobacter sp. SYSU D00873]
MKNNNRLLLIEDDKDLREILLETLRDDNWEVKAIEGTRDVISDVQEFQPSLVVVDYILPTINGGELCHQVKQNPLTSEIPVIMLSAYPRVLNSLGNYGWDMFIEKPFDLWFLLDKINQYSGAKASYFQGMKV